MRRKDREITDIEEKLGIIRAAKVCRLAMAHNGMPYIVPLNFGYSYEGNELRLYFHSAREGKKIDWLKQNGEVCFEMDLDHELTEGKTACEYGFNFSSVIGFGSACFPESPEEKKKALQFLMDHQTGGTAPCAFDGDMLNAVSVFVVKVREFTGKRRSKH